MPAWSFPAEVRSPATIIFAMATMDAADFITARDRKLGRFGSVLFASHARRVASAGAEIRSLWRAD